MELQERILEELNKNEAPVGVDDLAVELDAPLDETESALEELRMQGQIMYTRKGKAALPRWLGSVCGRLQANSKGYGFVLPLDKEEDDVYIPSYAMGGALHDDIVAARVTARAQKGKITRREGEIIEILKRARERIVCVYDRSGSTGLAKPEDGRMAQPILIPSGMENGAHTGDLVVVEITSWPDDWQIAEGRVCEVLGQSGSAAADVLGIVRHYGLYDEFSPESSEQAEGVNQTVGKHELKGREDFRSLACVTIDGEDAKDFDDAISMTRDGDNYTLGVHIADVSHYVKRGSPIDADAFERGTSTYFPDKVLPMLPFPLSNGICSLRQGEDRLCLSCMITIRPDGSIAEYSFHKSVINVSRRLTYTATNAMLGGDKATIGEYADVYPLVRDMQGLADILTARRTARGSIDFDLPESRIVLDEEGRPVDIYPYERGASNIMIEEFMLTANECAAMFAQANELPFVYRIHEQPNEERIDELFALLETLGVNYRQPKGTHIKPKALQQLLKQVEGEAYASVVNRVMLRCQKKAVYSEENKGHFGLALRNYCHYTSPIRRYPDLVVHRAISAFISGGLEQKALERQHRYMKETAAHCSERERVSMEAERAVDDLKKAEYMQGRIGEEYTGVISGVTDFGLFVELPTTVEGMIRLTSLEDDYYIYDEKQYRIIGQRGGKVYSMGDKIDIIVAAVDLGTHKIEFHPAGVARRPARQTRRPRGQSRRGGSSGSQRPTGQSGGQANQSSEQVRQADEQTRRPEGQRRKANNQRRGRHRGQRRVAAGQAEAAAAANTPAKAGDEADANTKRRRRKAN